MNATIDRRYWPFPVEADERTSAENQAKIDFLEAATQQGLRAFLVQDDCGATADDGRECQIVWRGKQRAEVLYCVDGVVVLRSMRVDPQVAIAFRQAAKMALEWFRAEIADVRRANVNSSESAQLVAVARHPSRDE